MPKTIWNISKAKEVLKKDVIDGTVNDTMDAQYLYLIHKEYIEYDFNFQSL
jgi:hypothetical protein